MADGKVYVNVILPLKLRGTLTYCAPQEIQEGGWVRVRIRNCNAIGIVEKVLDRLPSGMNPERIKTLEPVPDKAPVGKQEVDFWKDIAQYYMCTEGEVFKAAYSTSIQNAVTKVPKRKPAQAKEKAEADFSRLKELSPAQLEAEAIIRRGLDKGRPVLLHGITGSGKTEIYLKLAAEQLQSGRSVLMLVPEIAISRQLQQRVEAIFGNSLLVFHSKQTVPSRKKTIEALRSGERPRIVLGTRSAVFLPFKKLGLVIVDEEHDHSYKQEDPAPRYNGRDAAIMLGTRLHAGILLGSATPSLESLYNVSAGKYSLARLENKYHDSSLPSVEIIDTVQERRLRNMQGSFSRGLLKQIKQTADRGEQVMIFRSRRAYSPFVQCGLCGNIPKCPHCNVSLSYHKFSNTLSCHYCGYGTAFSPYCKECGEPALEGRGTGTEKLEEELQSVFPDLEVARFDAETTASKTVEEKTIKDFAAGNIDILVGTQMITKGFDFEKLSLVAIINADSILAVQDFRSDEKALQLITQLLGRAGRRDKPGKLVIQTAQADHPVIKAALEAGRPTDPAPALEERRIFRYPPYVRLITITVKDRQEGRLWNVCRRISEAAAQCGIKDIAGPITPALEMVDKYHIREFWIKLERDRSLVPIKKALSERIELLEKEFKGGPSIILDVDPL